MKTAYVLAGGGAKGAWQAGVMAALHEAGVYPDHVFGTSVGALNACAYAYTGIAGVMGLWNSITGIGDVFSRRWNPLANSLFTSDPLWKKILTVTSRTKATAAVAHAAYCDLWTGQTGYAADFHPNYKSFVLASASLPVICPPVDSRFVDGGVAEPCPLKAAVRLDVDRIFVILCSSLYARQARPQGKWQIALRAFDIACQEILRDDVSGALRKNNEEGYKKLDIRVVQPELNFEMGTLDFEPVKIKEAIECGSMAGKRCLSLHAV